MGDAGVLVEDGRLAADLVATLEPQFQDALNHPTRRDILRVLQGARQPRSITDIAAALPQLSRGEISYHAQVLEDSGCVEVDGSRRRPGGQERLLRSAVGDSGQALLVLGATERSDREHRRRAAAEPPSSQLTMFRVPRPARTVRLLGRRRREAH
jgi:DNA-binding transcriptional ArsR family regulator